MQTKWVLLGLLLALVGCGQKVAVDRISTPADRDKAMSSIVTLTNVSFEKLLYRTPLDEKDKADLTQAEPIAQDLVDYDPLDVGFGAILGKIRLGLAETSEAELSFKNALLIQPKADDTDDAAIRAGIHADLSQLYFDKKEFEKALSEIRDARRIMPQDPFFMTNEASTLIELERYGLAKTLCQDALKIDPGHKPASDLLKLLDGADPTAGS